MKKQIFEYFKNLESLSDNKYNNMLIADGETVEIIDDHRYNVAGVPVFAKTDSPENILFGVASAEMYNDNGIIAPKTAPVLIPSISKSSSIILPTSRIGILSQDVKGLKEQGFEVATGTQIKNFWEICNHDIHDEPTTNKWFILYNKNFRKKFLNIMTEDCFDDFTTLLLADEFRTDTDRCWRNLFFYKSKNADKYEGIITIDLENEQFLHLDLKPNKDPFDAFLKSSYKTYTFDNSRDSFQPYSERLKNIKNLLRDGVLTPEQKSTFKNILNYGLAEKIKQKGEKYDLQDYAYRPYEFFSKIEEYSKDVFGNYL